MRPESLYLTDIVESADSIQRFVAGVSEEDFEENELIHSAVLQKLIVIGEAVARLPKELRERYPEAQWNEIVGFRNIAVHAYFSVLWSLVWTTTQEDVPVLREIVVRILHEEYPELGY